MTNGRGIRTAPQLASRRSGKILLFSHDIFSAQATGGISRCMIELMHALDSTRSAPWQLYVGHNNNALLAEASGSTWYAKHAIGASSATGRRSPLSALRNERGLRSLVGPGTIVHRTYHPVVDLLPRSALVIETVHDMWDFVAADERGPRAMLRRHLKRRALERADRIVCVSQSTRDYLGNLSPRLADRAIVIPHGTSRLSDRPAPVDRERPFFLFVGRRDRYKNFAVLLHALALLHRDAELVCFGGGPLTTNEKEIIAQFDLTERIHQTGGDDHLLAGHYRAACALLYPSRHEGFGLPLLEAMSLGCPVIAAPLTSLPEVGGDAALYADADDPQAWRDTMALLIDSEDVRNKAVNAGHARAGTFSWQATAQRHAALYKEMEA
ncbi:glycosyltransferase family 4 protein [Sphingomonas dokdonensis]|uniref:glycosyltransferase family 4 protein n=1 Tax=Sphingomonas dokdonensis TaxID=344880 RepID=UPI00117BDA09|nr:glycosyltransferase family 1 protein [Sphingomonas dokdonensis]